MSERTIWPVPHPLRYEARVPAHPLSIAYVRRAVQSVAEVCGPSIAEMVGLMFTELVTNAIRHSGVDTQEQLEVAFELRPDGMRGAVCDHGKGFEAEADPTPREDGGFGLFIVDRLARQWGVERQDDATEVWFEF